MGQQAFDFGAAPANTLSFNGLGSYNDGVAVPLGRVTLNGLRPIGVTGIVMYLGGNGGARTATLYVGSSQIVGINVPAAGGGQAVGGACSFTTFSNGGTVRVGYDTSGLTYFGWNTVSGRTLVEVGAGNRANAQLAGYYDWVEAPSAPQSVVATPGSGGSATLNFAAPASNGGSAVSDYVVEYSTSSTFASGVTSFNTVLGSNVITGLTPGATYYFRVAARNAVTNAYSTSSVWSATASASLGSVPDAPTGVDVTASAGMVHVAWVAPAYDGGVAISGYQVDIATDAGFTAGLATITRAASLRSATVASLVPGTQYYARVRAVNAVGASVNSGTDSATVPARGALDIVREAAVSVDGLQVEIRSDGADVPVLTLGYTAFGTGSTFVTIDVVPTGSGSSLFSIRGAAQSVALVADPAGHLFVIGSSSANTILVKRYNRTATTTWVAGGLLSQALPTAVDPIAHVAAAYVPGTTPSILTLVRRAGLPSAGQLAYATLRVSAIVASSGSLFINSGTDPSWLTTPPSGQPAGRGVLDVSVLVAGGTRFAIVANAIAVVDVTNGAVAGVSKGTAGASLAGIKARVLGVSSTVFALVSPESSTSLTIRLYSTLCVQLGTASLSGATAQGGAFIAQWDAYYDRVAGVVRVYYVADDSDRKLETVTISPTTFAASAITILSSALGAASSINTWLRVPTGHVDERRVVVAAANLLAGAKSTTVYVDTAGNVAPTAPTTTDLVGYDATVAQLVSWVFGDPNTLDASTAYEVEVQRVSDSVDVVDTGKVVSTASSYTIGAAALVNGVNYRWRVRTWDALDTVGTWSAYDAFVTSALGTLTVTTPATDNLAGLETASLNVVWTYVQGDGYAQTQRRVRAIRTSDSSVLSDTTMQASAVGNYTVTGLPTDVEVRVEVSIITNAPTTPTITATRLVTASYSAAMTPLMLLVVGPSYVVVNVTNPTPTGDRPDIAINYVERRELGLVEFLPLGSVGEDGVFNDYAVKSGQAYEYRIRAVTA